MFGTGTGFSFLSAATDYIFILHYQSANVNNNLGHIPHDISQIHLQFNYHKQKGGSYENKRSSCATHHKPLQGEKYSGQCARELKRNKSVNDLQYAQHEEPKSGRSIIAKICDGLEISIRDFFNDDLFDNIEQEII